MVESRWLSAWEMTKTLDCQKGEIIRLLSHAWMLYAETFPDGRNYNRFLAAIQEAQLAVFEEDDSGA